MTLTIIIDKPLSHESLCFYLPNTNMFNKEIYIYLLLVSVFPEQYNLELFKAMYRYILDIILSSVTSFNVRYDCGQSVGLLYSSLLVLILRKQCFSVQTRRETYHFVEGDHHRLCIATQEDMYYQF